MITNAEKFREIFGFEPYRYKCLDIYFASYKQMSRYNSNYQTISRVTFPFGKPGESEDA